MISRPTLALLLGILSLSVNSAGSLTAAELELVLRSQTPVQAEVKRFHTATEAVTWKGEQTALIVCDVWDTHTCKNAAMRVAEMAPRLNRLVQEARHRGVTIIHAPSNCMDSYLEHPARLRAINAPRVENYPADITKWCYQIPAEEAADYPIDQTNGGCDDDPEVHKLWKASQQTLLNEKGWPWRTQHEAVKIDEQKDYISDRGDEVWNILQKHGIQNVIMTGVHTNMCVLGRPFGLRRLVTAGMQTALVRDMTDTMYDPNSAPFVSHFTGTDLIISHIERHVCPTVTSDQLIGGEEFRFQKDTRPHLAIVMSEDEYRTEETLTRYAIDPLGKYFRVSLIYGSETDRNAIPGLAAIQQADALLVSIRRRVLPADDLQLVRDYVAAGKPVIGIRTASHSFSLRNMDPPEGFADWKRFDPEVFGGNYTNHYGNNLVSMVQVENVAHPILRGLPREPFKQGWSLYKTSPLEPGTTTLLTGTVEGHPAEPVAWTFIRADGGRSFYTSLGHVDDFEHPTFRQLLLNGIQWTLAK